MVNASFWQEWLIGKRGTAYEQAVGELAQLGLAEVSLSQFAALHIGSGTARDMRALLRDQRVQRVTAVDTAPEAMARAKAVIASIDGAAERTTLLQKPAQQLTAEDIGSPAFVLADSVLVYMPTEEQEALIGLVAGQVQAGGVFAFNISKMHGELRNGPRIYAIDKDLVRKILAKQGMKTKFVSTNAAGDTAQPNEKPYGYRVLAVKSPANG